MDSSSFKIYRHNFHNDSIKRPPAHTVSPAYPKLGLYHFTMPKPAKKILIVTTAKIIISHTALQNTIPNASRLCPSKKSVTGYAKIIEPEINAEITKVNKNIKMPTMGWTVKRLHAKAWSVWALCPARSRLRRGILRFAIHPHP